jgi:hypothetical protein
MILLEMHKKIGTSVSGELKRLLRNKAEWAKNDTFAMLMKRLQGVDGDLFHNPWVPIRINNNRIL